MKILILSLLKFLVIVIIFGALKSIIQTQGQTNKELIKIKTELKDRIFLTWEEPKCCQILKK